MTGEAQVIENGRVIAIRLAEPRRAGELVTRDGSSYIVTADGYSLVPVDQVQAVKVGIGPLGIVLVVLIGIAFACMGHKRG